MEKNNNTLILFTNINGTLKFENVTDLVISEKAIEFDYYGLSIDEARHATFKVDDIYGWSVTK